MTVADAFLIGAMKSGTTTLATQLGLQDGVFVTNPKEPNYFSDDDVFAQGPEWYSGLFNQAGPNDLMIDASTHYTKLPTYPNTVGRMREATPNPRLIYMIRNPVERAVSHFIHEWTEGRAGKDISAAFREDRTFVQYGQYAMQLRPFVQAFGADRIFLTSLEQIKQDGPGEFRRIADFLGLSPDARWLENLPAQNVSAQRVRTFPLWKLLLDTPLLRTARRTLIPKSVRTWVWNMRSMENRPELSAAQRAALEATFLQDRGELASLWPNHPALTLCYPFAETS